MGQQPFYPPNVAGWPSNADWLSTLSGKARVDAASHLLGRKLHARLRLHCIRIPPKN